MIKAAISRLTKLGRKPSNKRIVARDSSLRDRFPDEEIGEGSYGDLTVHRYHSDVRLRIGSYTSVARGAQVLLGGEHRTDFVSMFPFNYLWDGFDHLEGHPFSRGDVSIGSDVWIGREAMIFSGVTIGDGAVIGARAIVNGDVPPYAIFAGQPARLIRYRFDEATIARLLEIKWWSWPRERIAPAVPYLMTSDIETFLELAEAGKL